MHLTTLGLETFSYDTGEFPQEAGGRTPVGDNCKYGLAATTFPSSPPVCIKGTARGESRTVTQPGRSGGVTVPSQWATDPSRAVLVLALLFQDARSGTSVKAPKSL